AVARSERRAQPAAFCAEDREIDVVLDGEAEEEPRLLVGAGEPATGPVPRRRVRHVPPEQLDGSGRGGKVARDDVEQRRLAGPVRPENGAALAGRDLEADVADGVETTEAPADPPKAEGRLGGLRWSCFRQPVVT